MPEVTFVQPDGTRATCSLQAGESVLDAALDNGIPGILGQCGGGCTCATCHVYVLDAHPHPLPPPDADEVEMLAYVWAPAASSRLACQIRMANGLHSVLVEVPARQA